MTAMLSMYPGFHEGYFFNLLMSATPANRQFYSATFRLGAAV